MKKKIRLGVALCLGMISLLLPTACGKKPAKPTYMFDFNDTLTAELSQTYDPQISVGEDTKIVSVILRNDGGVEIPLNEGYTFVPTAFGDYYYNIVVESKGVQKTYVKTVSVLDKVAPVVKETLATKNVALGLYVDFETDLENIIVSDNNLPMLGYVTKKVVAITFDGKTEENAAGFSEYLIKKVGSYTVKVLIADVAGNTAYTTYTLNAQDKEAPNIKAFSVYYAWLDSENKITVPSVKIDELSSYESSIEVKRNGQTLSMKDGKVAASLGDKLTLKYTATDEYDNQSSVTTILKVLEKGKLFDVADEGVASLFKAGEGMIEYENGAISYIMDGNMDTFGWADGAYTFGNASEFSGIAFTIKNYEKSNVNALVAATVNGEKIYVGNIPLKSASESVTYVLDITKYGLEEIDGWTMELQAGASMRFELIDAYFTTFADPYFEVKNLTKTYKIGETLSFEKLLFHGEEISEYTITVAKDGEGTTLSAGERYAFASAGTYSVTFTVDIGNQKFVTTEMVTVANEAITVKLDKSFTAGKVGEKYILPTATLSDGAQTLITKVVFENEEISLANHSFTPAKSGVYTVEYLVNGVKLDSYVFAVEKANAIDFENAQAFVYKNVYGGGFKKNQDMRYVTSGLTSAKANVSAQGIAGGLFATPYALTSDCNSVQISVYANTAGQVKLTLLVGENMKRYESDTVWLNAGNNTITFRIDGKTNAGIGGLLINNNAKYDNIYFIDAITCTNVTSLTSVFTAETQTYEGEQGTLFVIPELLRCDSSFIKKYTLTMTGANLKEDRKCYVGEKISLSELEVGSYNIIYKATDIFGVQHEKTAGLTVTETSLAGEIVLGDYFVGDMVDLPDPILQSNCYDESELATAKVRKYYRPEGGLEWQTIAKGDIFQTTGNVDVKYTVTLGGTKISLYANTYIHAQGIHFDYEKYSSGDHMGWDLSYSSTRGNDTYITDAWSHGGSYSAHITAHIGYNDTNGIIFGERVADENGNMVYKPCEPIQLGFKADTVVFWAYSEADRMPTELSIDNYDWKWASGMFQLKKGAHKYVVKLDKEFDSYTRFLFTVKKNESFYIDDVSFVKSGTPVFPEVAGKEYFSNDPISLEVPKVLNASTIAFTQSELKSMVSTLTVSKGKTQETYTYGNEPLQLELAKGEYVLDFKITIGMFEYTSSQKIKVRGVNCDFVEPRTVFESGVEYEVSLPEVYEDGVTLGAYYRKEGASEWTELTIHGDKAKVTLNGSGTFELKFTAQKGRATDIEIYKVLVRAENTLFDFELDDETDETYYDLGISQYQGYITDAWSHDGKYSWYVYTEGHDYGSFKYFTQYVNGQPNGSRVLNEEYDTVTMWIKTTSTVSDFKLGIFDNENRWVYAETVTLPANTEAMYTFKMNGTFKEIFQFGFGVHYSYRNRFYIDSIHAYKSEVNKPNLSTLIYTDETIEFDEIKIKGVPDTVEVSSTVKYKQTGDSAYTNLVATDGTYTLAPTKSGKIELVIETSYGFTKETFTYQIEVMDKSKDPSVDDTEWNNLS